MTSSRHAISGVTLLAAAVLVLLPALAWLQYSWLEQIADADRDRRARTLQTAASQLAQDFDGEIGKAVFGLQLEPAVSNERDWSRFAAQISAVGRQRHRAGHRQGGLFRRSAGPTAAHAARPLCRSGTRRRRPSTQTVAGRLATITHAVPSRRTSEHASSEINARPSGRRASACAHAIACSVSCRHADRRRAVGGRPGHARDGEAAGGRMPAGPPDVKLLGFTIIRFDIDGARAATSCRLWSAGTSTTTIGGTRFSASAVVARDEPRA